jgi:hypothetical protein
MKHTNWLYCMVAMKTWIFWKISYFPVVTWICVFFKGQFHHHFSQVFDKRIFTTSTFCNQKLCKLYENALSFNLRVAKTRIKIIFWKVNFPVVTFGDFQYTEGRGTLHCKKFQLCKTSIFSPLKETATYAYKKYKFKQKYFIICWNLLSRIFWMR